IFDNDLYAPLETDQVYGRVDFNLSDTVSTYVDIGFARSKGENKFLPLGTNGLPGANGLSGAEILAENAFLPESVRTALTDSGASSFILSRYEKPNSVVPNVGNRNRTENVLATLGFEGGIFEKFNWDAGVRYGRTSQFVVNTNNTNS